MTDTDTTQELVETGEENQPVWIVWMSILNGLKKGTMQDVIINILPAGSEDLVATQIGFAHDMAEVLLQPLFTQLQSHAEKVAENLGMPGAVLLGQQANPDEPIIRVQAARFAQPPNMGTPLALQAIEEEVQFVRSDEQGGRE